MSDTKHTKLDLSDEQLRDAIAHLDELLDEEHEFSCVACRYEHEQLRAWLIELLQRRHSE